MSSHTLSRAAAMMCANPDFQKWLNLSSKETAAEFIRVACNVKSRREFDTDPEAAQRFHTLRKQFINQKEEQCKN